MNFKTQDGKIGYFIDDKLARALDKMKHDVRNKDLDKVIIVDGLEGVGKSLFAMQMCKYVDETFNIDRVFMNGEDLKKGIEKASKFQALLFDEAFKGLSSRESLRRLNNVIISKIMEMRQKNLFLVVCIPSIFMLDRYVTLFRSVGLFHIYRNKGKRGFWLGYNQKNKRLLYILGKKTMAYSKPRIYGFRGRFYGKYPIDEQQYRQKKLKALEEIEKEPVKSKYNFQRDVLVCDFVVRNKLNYREAAEAFKKMGLVDESVITWGAISKIMQEYKKKKRDKRENTGK